MQFLLSYFSCARETTRICFFKQTWSSNTALRTCEIGHRESQEEGCITAGTPSQISPAHLPESSSRDGGEAESGGASEERGTTRRCCRLEELSLSTIRSISLMKSPKTSSVSKGLTTHDSM